MPCDEGAKNFFYGLHCTADRRCCEYCGQNVCGYHSQVNTTGMKGGHSGCSGPQCATTAIYKHNCRGSLVKCSDCGNHFCSYHADAVRDAATDLKGGHVCVTSMSLGRSKMPARLPTRPPLTQVEFNCNGVRQEHHHADQIGLLVFNCGLLRLRDVTGNVLFENPPLADERFEHLSGALFSSDADVIALSEIYEDAHVDCLLDSLRAIYPYHARGDARGPLEKLHKFHNGLLFLSKHPIESQALTKHARAAPVEDMFGSKCMLAIRTSCGNLGRLFLVNMHTTAGGTDPEGADEIRQSELREAVDACEAAALQGCRAVILGDLNMGPEASKDNYEFLLRHGYTDEVVRCCGGDSGQVITWDPENPLNAVGPHKTSPPQRCDHVFAHGIAGLKGSSMHMMFTEACVETSLGPCTISDHYGILLNLVSGSAAPI